MSSDAHEHCSWLPNHADGPSMLQVGDRVSGLLDFEFCSYDWRAMELAVALSKCRLSEAGRA
eukprot:1161900-Pelagomonas_calceolata.AAC.13